MEMRLQKIKLEKNTAITRTAEYRKLRYDGDVPLGHQEARTLADEKIVDAKCKVEEMETYIYYLQGLLSIMKGFDNMQRR